MLPESAELGWPCKKMIQLLYSFEGKSQLVEEVLRNDDGTLST